MGSAGEPLYLDVCAALADSGRSCLVTGGRYGLSSKDTTPSQIRDVFDNLRRPEPMKRFSIGITDDVTMLSLPAGEELDTEKGNILMSCKFWGLGSDGTVGANRNTVEIINAATPLYAQAYFEYDAKKSYGLTRSHLRIGKSPVRASHGVHKADIVACHCQNYVNMYDMAGELKEGGSFLLNCAWQESELEEHLPPTLKKNLAEKKARLFLIDATALAHELGLGHHVNTILQAAFFRLSGILSPEEGTRLMEEAVKKTYFSKGEDMVARNTAAIRAGMEHVFEARVPASWVQASGTKAPREGAPSAVTRLLDPINAQQGDSLPVSAFLGYEDGRMDMGLTAWEKRDIAVHVPRWEAGRCAQCNLCSLVCPHAVIRPYLLTGKELAEAPQPFAAAPAKGKEARGLFYTLQVSVRDCTGCGSCVESCPQKGKALSLIPRAEAENTEKAWRYALNLPQKADIFDPFTVKGSQFRRPLLEFSAACAGCGETPYAKLLTQLFGPRAYWANATGCSQAWGAAMPGIPYAVDEKGRGPAWSNSLFENNAEFCLGMLLADRSQREAEKERVLRLIPSLPEGRAREAALCWLDSFDDFDASGPASDILKEELELLPYTEEVTAVLAHADRLSKKCFWMFGGDGWAYDIGFGGLDHVLSTGEDINVLVADTEVYSNTGGQASKATPMGAVAQFSSSGKKSAKKDLGAMFLPYGNIYIAQVSMGASPAHLMAALREASAYPGPSLVIAYAPCTAHGIRAGMAHAQEEMKRATAAGYWPLYRHHPEKSPSFTLDSPPPRLDYGEFLRGEMRYEALERTFPDEARRLGIEAEKKALARYRRYEALARSGENREN
ncbi:pyruvate:ferredoxin (flavodoxin) oxidoreductase [Mailhella massiliensis]|nr:pyruvate:ferredoxin (flavodoxin) oxidoreductase [Mailhella massiliensis]